MEDGLFPMKIGDDLTEEKIEEERRLFYVALTRAKKRVFITHAFIRNVFGSEGASSPSRFLGDIPIALLENESTYGRTTLGGGTGLLDDIDF
ncbi:MAG: 3'-5' exonuclease, partial [Patescibacteria group bacterium]